MNHTLKLPGIVLYISLLTGYIPLSAQQPVINQAKKIGDFIESPSYNDDKREPNAGCNTVPMEKILVVSTGKTAIHALYMVVISPFVWKRANRLYSQHSKKTTAKINGL